jgi:sugar lactone lactonase YvrE
MWNFSTLIFPAPSHTRGLTPSDERPYLTVTMTYRTALSAVLDSRGLLVAALPFALVAFACGGAQPEAAPPPPPPPVEAPTAAAPTPPPAAPAATAAAPATPPEPTPPTAAWRVTEGIQTPESVLYDAAADRYLVSNINGSTTDVDNNGYITEISGDGKVTKAKLVEGGAGKTKLDAPKGLALAGNVLYVSDITVVRKFDAKTGAPKGEIPIKDSTFLNDLALAPDGRLFVSDSGIKPGANGAFDPTGTDAVYVIDKAGKVKPLAKSKDLGGPNGLLWTEKGVLAGTFNSDELYRLNAEGAKEEVTKIPTGGLDGIVAAGDSLLVTSWKGSTIYRGKLGGKFEPVIQGVKGPADIGFDTKRSRVLVPRFVDNAVEAYDLK